MRTVVNIEPDLTEEEREKIEQEIALKLYKALADKTQIIFAFSKS